MHHSPPLVTASLPFRAIAWASAVELTRLPNMELPPLSEGNWLQRRYARWAEPHYRRMAPELRQEVERYDRWLYSRRGLVFWAGLLVAVAATVAALMAWVGMSAGESLVLAFLIWFTQLVVLAGAWRIWRRDETAAEADRYAVEKAFFRFSLLYLFLHFGAFLAEAALRPWGLGGW